MEYDQAQPTSPPHDGLQRLLQVLSLVIAALALLWVLSPLAMLVLLFVPLMFVHPFRLAILTPAMYLLHFWFAASALIFLLSSFTAIVYERAPERLSPAQLRVLARQPTWRPGSGWRAAWTGIWSAIYFGAFTVLFPWPPLPRTISPSVLLLGAALPIMLIVACGPSWWYRMSERRRRISTP